MCREDKDAPFNFSRNLWFRIVFEYIYFRFLSKIQHFFPLLRSLVLPLSPPPPSSSVAISYFFSPILFFIAIYVFFAARYYTFFIVIQFERTEQTEKIVYIQIGYSFSFRSLSTHDAQCARDAVSYFSYLLEYAKKEQQQTNVFIYTAHRYMRKSIHNRRECIYVLCVCVTGLSLTHSLWQ